MENGYIFLTDDRGMPNAEEAERFLAEHVTPEEEQQLKERLSKILRKYHQQ